jgi:MFS family permease
MHFDTGVSTRARSGRAQPAISIFPPLRRVRFSPTPSSRSVDNATVGRAPPAFAAFSSPDFRFYAASRFLATTAVQMQSVAVGFQVYALTGRPLDLGYVGLAQFLPVAGLSLLAGHAADRFDRRWVLLACDVVYALAALALYAVTRARVGGTLAIYAILFVVGAARAFYGPAASSLMPDTVEKDKLANAVSWHSSLWQLAAIGGPSLGGVVYGLAGSAEPVYLASAIAFGAAAALVLGIRVRRAITGGSAASIRNVLAGLRYVFRNRLLLGSISLDFFAVFLGGAVALLPVFATSYLHVGPMGLGLLRAAPAAGAGVMALVVAFRPLVRDAGAKMFACVAIFGAATIVFALSRNFVLSLASLVVMGAADMVSVVVRMTLAQAATPPDMRGRVSAVNMVFIGASNELGEFESGVAAAWLGVVPSVIAGGLGTIGVVALWIFLFPALRKVDRPEAVEPLPIEPRVPEPNGG